MFASWHQWLSCLSSGGKMSALTLTLSSGVSVKVVPESKAKQFPISHHTATNSQTVPLPSESQRKYIGDTLTQGAWTGAVVWESGQVLAELLSAEPDRVKGKRVLELGTGCGLVGLAAGGLAAREVTLTDEVLFMASYNLTANFSARPELYRIFRLQQLNWGDQEAIEAAGPPYDVLLGSDILYFKENLGALAETIVSLAGVGTTVILSTPDWDLEDAYVHRFQQHLEAHGFKIRDISADTTVSRILASFVGSEHGDAWHDDCAGHRRRGPVRVIEMTHMVKRHNVE